MSVRWAPLLFLSLTAAVPFHESFEGNLFATDTPPGNWGGLTEEPGQSLKVELDAGHRGQRGLVYRDPLGGALSGQVWSRLYVDDGRVNPRERHYRFWLKASETGGVGTTSILSAIGDRTNAEVLVSSALDGGQLLSAQCYDAAMLPANTGEFPFDSEWHLVELASLGIGSDAGSCELALDGVRLASVPRDYSVAFHNIIVVGGAYANDAYLGNIAFDDMAIGPARWADRLLISTDGGRAGDCLAGTVTAVDVDGRVAPLSSEATVSLSGVDVFEPGCTTPFTTRALNSPLAFAWRARDAGTFTLTASSDDLAGSSTQLVATASPQPPARELQVACGCSTGAEALLALALLTASRRARAPRFAARARSSAPGPARASRARRRTS